MEKRVIELTNPSKTFKVLDIENYTACENKPVVVGEGTGKHVVTYQVLRIEDTKGDETTEYYLYIVTVSVPNMSYPYLSPEASTCTCSCHDEHSAFHDGFVPTYRRCCHELNIKPFLSEY